MDACLCSILQSTSGATLLIMVTAVDQEISGGPKMVCVGLGGLMRLGFRFSLESWVFFWVFFWWVSKWVWLFSFCIEIGRSLGSDTAKLMQKLQVKSVEKSNKKEQSQGCACKP